MLKIIYFADIVWKISEEIIQKFLWVAQFLEHGICELGRTSELQTHHFTCEETEAEGVVMIIQAKGSVSARTQPSRLEYGVIFTAPHGISFLKLSTLFSVRKRKKCEILSLENTLSIIF